MPRFSYQVECWMSLIMGNMQLSTRVDADKAMAELKIENEVDGLAGRLF